MSSVSALIDDLAFPDPEVDVRHGQPLSPREKEILRLKSDGALSKEVASDLDISEQTVKNHITSILVKTGAPNLLAVCVRYARSQHGPDCPLLEPSRLPWDEVSLEDRVTVLERVVGLR